MSPVSASAFARLPRRAHCTQKAREIVLNIINAAKTPVSTRNIYDLAVTPAHAGTPGPHESEEIRSMTYLKRTVLPDLVAQNRVEMVRVKGTVEMWLWIAKQAPPTSKSEPKPTNSDSNQLTTAAVGVGEDWSHLNKRRQRARLLEVESDVVKMLETQKKQKKVAWC